MIDLNDYEKGLMWVNRHHIVAITQQIRDCRISFTNGDVCYVTETDAEVLQKIHNYDL